MVTGTVKKFNPGYPDYDSFDRANTVEEMIQYALSSYTGDSGVTVDEMEEFLRQLVLMVEAELMSEAES